MNNLKTNVLLELHNLLLQLAGLGLPLLRDLFLGAEAQRGLLQTDLQLHDALVGPLQVGLEAQHLHLLALHRALQLLDGQVGLHRVGQFHGLRLRQLLRGHAQFFLQPVSEGR